MKKEIENNLPLVILNENEPLVENKNYNFVSGIRIGKKIFCLLEFRKISEEDELEGFGIPSFISFDLENKEDIVGKPLSKKDFDDLLSIFFTKEQIEHINDTLYPDFPIEEKDTEKNVTTKK